MAQTQLRWKLAQVAIKEESSQDTYEVADAGACFLATDLSYTVTTEMYSPDHARGDGLNMDDVPGVSSVVITFTVPLKGSGTAGTAPESDEALKACGLDVANVPATSDTFVPEMIFDGAGGNPGISYTCSILVDGMVYAAVGSFGNVVFNGTVGAPLMMEFTFTGAYHPVALQALLVASYDTSVAPAFMGASFATSIDKSTTPVGVTSLSIDLGNVVQLVNDVNGTHGVTGARIVGRKTTGSYNPEVSLPATEDFFGAHISGKAGTITTGAVGSAGNRWTISLARVVTGAPQLEDRSGVAALTIPFTVSSLATAVEVTNPDITLFFD